MFHEPYGFEEKPLEQEECLRSLMVSVQSPEFISVPSACSNKSSKQSAEE